MLTIDGVPPLPAVAAHRVQLFGSFELLAGDESIDLKSLRPRVRSLVRFLALNSGKLVHREAVLEALVAQRGVRLGPFQLAHRGFGGPPGTRAVLVHHRARVGLVPTRHSPRHHVGHDRIPNGTAVGAQGRVPTGDSARAYDDFTHALSLYTDDLLNEEGPSEWIVAHRDRLRHEAVNAAIAAAEIALANDRHADVVATCERAVILDPCADRAWRLLTSAFERSGSFASAQRARQAYLDVQQKLGIDHDGSLRDAIATVATT